jgi:hypothetical protein
VCGEVEEEEGGGGGGRKMLVKIDRERGRNK